MKENHIYLKEDGKMKNLIKVLMALALGAIICLPGIASAYPTVDLYEVRVDNAAVANIHAASLGDLGAYAGNYILAVSNPSGSGNPFVEFSGYCVEPAYSSHTSQVYELLPIAQGTPFAAAAWILSQNYTTLAPAAQAAVWELTWDTAKGNGFDLSADNFRLYGGVNAGDVTTIYNNAIANMNTFNTSGYVIASNPVGSTDWKDSQNYIIHNPVPVPPSALLLGSGLLGLAGLRYRRKKSS
jgi:hypothetical protein